MQKYQAIILSAGIGSRLLPLTLTRPKALMRLPDSRTILQHQLDSLSRCARIGGFTIVCGHQFNSMKRAADIYEGAKIDLALNPFYSASGPLGSIWIALQSVTSNHLVITNGDTVLSSGFSELLDPILDKGKDGFYLLCSKNTRQHDDSVNVLVQQDGNLIAVGKELRPSDDTLESSGVFVISGEQKRTLFERTLHELFVDSEDPVIRWAWHAALNALIADGHPVKSVLVPSDCWKEIDSAEDLAHFDKTRPQQKP